MDTGNFTVFGHFIVLCGYDDAGFQVLDPFSQARSSVHWTYEQISGQISNLWAISADPSAGPVTPAASDEEAEGPDIPDGETAVGDFNASQDSGEAETQS